MSKTTMNVAKTVGIGLAAGAAAMTVGTVIMNKNQPHAMKTMKKTTNKTMNKMGKLIDNVESMFG